MGGATPPGKREVLLVAPEEEGEIRDDGRKRLGREARRS